MNVTTIQCKTTAPLFMAGPKKEKPEIRAASIKGVMRYIWRAAQNAVDMQALHVREGVLFGNADGDHTCVSPWKLQIFDSNKVKRGDESLLPYRTGTGRNGKYPTPSIRPASEFSVRIIGSDNPEEHLSIVRLFILTCMLAGFGRRSRKGMGTISIEKIEGTGESIRYTADECVNLLNSISSAGYTMKDDIITPAESGKGYPYIEKIKFSASQTDEKKLGAWQNSIGETAHEYAKEAFSGLANPRIASSLLLSTYSVKNQHYCVITQLHFVAPKNSNKRLDEAKRKEFISRFEGRL